MTAQPDRIALLGGFQLHFEERPVRLPLSAQRVLAFLALHERPLQRLYVAANLWPDSSEQRSHANLRTALWRLGRHGRRVVEATSTHLALAAQVEVDLRDATARAKRLVYGTGPVQERDLAALCDCGDLLPDWYDDWALIEREQLRQLRLSALERLCERLTQARRFPQATAAGLAAVACEPMRESAHRTLISAHLAAGNTGEAVRQYELCRDLFVRRLGVEPSPLLRDLADVDHQLVRTHAQPGH